MVGDRLPDRRHSRRRGVHRRAPAAALRVDRRAPTPLATELFRAVEIATSRPRSRSRRAVVLQLASRALPNHPSISDLKRGVTWAARPRCPCVQGPRPVGSRRDRGLEPGRERLRVVLEAELERSGAASGRAAQRADHEHSSPTNLDLQKKINEALAAAERPRSAESGLREPQLTGHAMAEPSAGGHPRASVRPQPDRECGRRPIRPTTRSM